MYKIVFLFIFSAATAIGGREVTLDIYTKKDTATGKHNLMCDVTPDGTQHALEGEKINFNVQTTSNLQDFWCEVNFKTIYNPRFDSSTITTEYDGKIQTWKLSGDHSSYKKASMDGKWICKFRIRKPLDMQVNASTINISSVEYMEGTCELHFQITERNISLGIAQIKDWTWKSEKQGIKRYDYKFIEGEKTFECILDNPTDSEENYTISFKLDGVPQKRSAKEVIKPRDKLILRHTFKLNSSSSVITCSATNVKGKGPNLQNDIYLQHIPAPRVFLNMHTIFSPEQQILKMGTLFRENNTQTYDYYFTDGEQVTFNCALNNAGGDEKNYLLTLCINGGHCARSEGEVTSISNTFTLKSGDQFKEILCKASNRYPAVPSLPNYLHSIIYLHYTSREDTLTATPMLIITGPEKMLRSSDTIYHYNFTNGETLELNCSLNSATGLDKNYDIVFFNYNVSTNLSDFVMSTRVLKTSLCVYHTFTLKKEDKGIRCGAFTGDHYDREYSIDVFLHYTPQPMQVLPYRNGSQFKMDFTLKGKNQNITCVVRKNKIPILTRVVKLNKKKIKTSGGVECLSCWCRLIGCQCPTSQVRITTTQPPWSASGLEFHMYGLPPNSCNATDPYKTSQRCTYTFRDPNRLGTTLPLKCVMEGKRTGKRAEFKIQFETNSQQVIFEPPEFTKKTVSYDISLKEENTTVVCTATKSTGDLKMTINVYVYYIPPTTPPTTTTEPSTTPIEPSITNRTPTSPESSDAALQSNNTGDGEDMGTGAWLKWAIAGPLIIIICVVFGCIVMYLQKKPPAMESTYANLGKDLNTHQTMPVPAPRIIQKPNGTEKAGAAKKPKMTMENNYSEPKDSQDMSEALYADPQRFKGDSETYAEPYVKSKPSPQSDTYADPYKPNYAESCASISEGNYAELSLPNNSKELYARPIPKAQRMPKVKDDSNYSNVFVDQYANTRK